MCHTSLSAADRARGIAALYVLDDALRGWGYRPNYEQHGDLLFKRSQEKNDLTSRLVAPRFNECVYRRLLGSMLHETLHACFGDTTKSNFGILWLLPYRVPEDVKESDEETYLAPFNFGEARAWVGVWNLGRAMFDIAWDVRTARDIGTYCFVGGNALNPPVPGYRSVAHIDRNHHAERYYTRGRKLEEEARAWFTPENTATLIEKIRAAAAIGEKSRNEKYAPPEEVARWAAKKIERNEPCVCGSAKKYKACCGATGTLGFVDPSIAR
jgi:hypothetical protein